MQRISVRGAGVAALVGTLFSLLPVDSVSAASASTKASPAPASTSASSSASASTSDDSSAPLDPVVVTATRLPQPESQGSSSVTVITSKQIEENGYVNLVQALQDVPGVSALSTGTTGQTTTLYIRGMTTRHNLILVDGKPLPQYTDGAYDLTDISLDNVERIEVARGAFAAVQGNGAAGGVINIITKKGQGLKKPEYSVTVEAGSYNTFREAVTARGAQGKLDYSAAYSSLLTTNQRRNNDYERENGSVNLGYQAYQDVRLSVDSTYRVTTTQNPGANQGSSKNDPRAWMQWETWTVTPTVDWKTTDIWSQSLSFQHSQQRVATDNDPAYTFTNNNRNQVDSNLVDWDHTFAVHEKLGITAGARVEDKTAWQFDDNARSLIYNNHQTNKSGYTGLDWEALEGWHLVPSVRAESYSDFGDFINWRAATSYVVPDARTKFKGAYGTATTAPSDQNFMTFGGFQTPNFNLKPEQTRGWEAGVEQLFFGDKWTVGATWFENTVDNLIATVSNTPVNVRHSRASGVELETGIHPISELDVIASYTLTNATNTDSNVRLTRVPRNNTSFNIVGRPVKNVTLALGGSWLNGIQDSDPVTFAKVNTPDQFATRFAATWKVTQNVELFGRIENLLNNQYEEVPGYPALDQAFYAGFKLTY